MRRYNYYMEGYNIFITGSSSGIGAATARACAKEKASVIITYHRNKQEADAVAEDCQNLGAPNVLVLQLDVQNTTSITKAAHDIEETFGHIDVLINNAGVISWEHLEQQSIQDIENQIRTNLEGTINVTKITLPLIKRTIINIASGAGKTGYAGLSVYCATKFGIRGFTQSIAKELDDITCYAVNPGMTATDMTDYQGIPPEKVADVILNTIKGKYHISSGADVDVWEYVE